MKYPTRQDIDELRDCGFDPSVIEEQTVLFRRGQLAEEIKDDIRQACAGYWSR